MSLQREPLAYTIPQFCEAVGFKKSKLYELAKAGRISVVKCDKRSFITMDEARRFMASLPVMKAA